MKNSQQNFRYKQIPTFLIEDSHYNDISNDAKILYSLLLSRHSLSTMNHQKNKNQWKDEHGIFIIFSRENMASLLNCSVRKVPSIMSELKLKGLVSEKRCGQGNPNRIYLKDPQDIFETTRCEKSADLEMQKSADLEAHLLPANELDNNKLDIINQSIDLNKEDRLINKETNISRHDIRKQISYDRFFMKIQKTEEAEQAWHQKLNLIDQLIEVMIQVYQAPNNTNYKIKGCYYTQKQVMQELLAVNGDCIEYICRNLMKAKNIQDVNAYMLTTLFTAPSSYKWALMQKESYDEKYRDDVCNAEENQWIDQQICEKLDTLTENSSELRMLSQQTEAYNYSYTVLQQIYTSSLSDLYIHGVYELTSELQNRIDHLQEKDWIHMIHQLDQTLPNLRYCKDAMFELVIGHLPVDQTFWKTAI